MTTRRIGFDIGGTKIACAVLDAQGTIIHEGRLPTPKSYDGIITTVAAMAREAGEGSIGIGAPGSASPRDGLWRNSNITLCNGKPFAADLQAAIGRPIRMENDANCVALAEARDGAGKGHGVVAFFTIGTGLGGGLVVDGRLIKGANGEAAEFGHTGLPWMTEDDWPPVPCFCGKRGCTEMYVSGTGFIADYLRATGQSLTGPEIMTRVRAGEAQAVAAFTRLQDRFARVIANLVNTIDPDIIIMGGGMSNLPELVEDMGARATPYTFSGAARINITRAAFGDHSGVRGAALLWD